MRKVFGTTLLVASLAFSQAAHEPKGDATGRAQGAVQPSSSDEQHHAQQEAKHGEAHPEGEAPMPNEIWWKWANFAVLAGGLGYLVSKYAGPFFRSRTDDIQKGIREAAQVRAEAEARAAEIESKVGNLSGELEHIRAKSHEEISAEGSRIQAETENQIKKIQAQAEMEIASAAKNATLDLKAYSAQLALDLAEKQIKQRLDAGTQEDLANAFVSDMKREKGVAQIERLQ